MRTSAPLTLLATLVVACAPTPSASERPSVILVCLDTVRADHLGCYGYTRRPTTPTLDGLAARGLLFRDVTAPASWTKPSVPSFLSGTFPAQHGVYEGSARRDGELATDLLGADVETLAEVFLEAGYDTAAFVRNAQLKAGRGFEQGFELYEDEAGDARELCAQALAWLDARADERPFFLYLHLLDAHWPYDIPDEAALRFADPATLERIRDGDWRSLRDAINDGDVQLAESERAAIVALYDAGLRFMDDQLGRLFGELQSRGLDQRTIVSVVADHGEEFLEHERIGHGHGLWENLTRVGWILAGPGVPAGETGTPVSLLDVFPTVLAAAGLSGSASTLAIDRLAEPDRDGPLFAEHKAPHEYVQSLREGGLKLVRRFTTRRPAGAAAADMLAAGDRWEAELREVGSGPWFAAQLKPREESPSDPTEIKTCVTGVTAGALTLAGLTVRLDAGTEVSGDLPTLDALAPGGAVKLRLVPDDGGWRAERVKLYAEAGDDPPEVRGTITAVELTGPGRGIVHLGGFPIAFDEQTSFKDLPAEAPRPELERSLVVALLEGGSSVAAGAGLDVEWRLFDLRADPGETQPLEVHQGSTDSASPEVRRLDEQLDRLTAGLATQRTWSTGSAVLDGDTVQDLRALGYIR